MSENANILPKEEIQRLIYLARGQKVLLDFDLATLYGVEARALNQAVKRNLERFPNDFMFQLSSEETLLVMRSQTVDDSEGNSSQIVMSSGEMTSAANHQFHLNRAEKITSYRKHRGLSYRPYAFTEQGVAMLSSVLRSPRAVRVNIEIMRAFVRLRQMLASNAALARRLEDLEKKYDDQFRVVFAAIRELMKGTELSEPRREMGFHTLRESPGPEYKVRRQQKRKA